MPRLAKAKKVPAKKTARKKKNEYAKPEDIPKGEILTDISKKQWKIGPSIGAGGFGEIYSACKASDSPRNLDDYDHVIKIEPHENGPLFVEMHFYMRNAKLEDIKKFCKKKGLKSIGMPHLIGSGSHEINGIKHRFIVMPRYGKDIWSYFIANNRKLPEHTIYRLAIQMIDVFEYIHGSSYVHADLKGANILLGFGKSGTSQAYLVDFGLASHYTTKDFKPDPKKMHNGTIEYTSRDAHNGVPTMRGDLEILGYNLVNWAGAKLPWESNNSLSDPSKVQLEKEEFMKCFDKTLDKLFVKTHGPIKEFFKYISSLKYNDVPEYEKCRKIFQNGLKTLGKTNSGDLDFKIEKGISNVSKIEQTSTSDFEDSPPRLKRQNAAIGKCTAVYKYKPDSPRGYRSHLTPVKSIKGSNIGSKAPKRTGDIIINNDTPSNPSSDKIVTLNVELDVSIDADVIINVKRKKKENDESSENEEISVTPSPVVRIRKFAKKSPRKGRSAK